MIVEIAAYNPNFEFIWLLAQHVNLNPFKPVVKYVGILLSKLMESTSQNNRDYLTK